MFYTREQLENQEAERLAGYGMKCRESRGRKYPEEEHPYRTAYQRDRDRIIHTTAFRRLEYKTQVFVNTEGDYYRTRLTHTVEVAQVGRTFARVLGRTKTWPKPSAWSTIWGIRRSDTPGNTRWRS